jgi:uncharacterized membrane protein YqgA involved in biofilm formation
MGAKIFGLGTFASQWLSLGMTGAFLNALGILLGAIFGLARRAPLSMHAQEHFRRALGVATIFFGARLVWLGVNGTFLSCAKQIFIALLAVTIGNWTGRLLRLQAVSNRLGQFAGKLIAASPSRIEHRATDGIMAGTILFCAAPLGWLGAVTDGLAGDFNLLAVKALMDGLAMSGFVKMFGWPAALSAFPVYASLGALTLACQLHAKPFLAGLGVLDAVNVTAGFVAGTVALVILEVRKVELANFLPALGVAPLLTRLLE